MSLKNLTPAQFANSIGVQRSGISHIVSGRNKPSLDFVLKILETYTDISESWLLMGKGEMLKSPPEPNAVHTSETMLSVQSLDSLAQAQQEIAYETKETSGIDPMRSGQEVAEKADLPVDVEERPVDDHRSKRLIKWVAFYDDDSFREFNRS